MKKEFFIVATVAVLLTGSMFHTASAREDAPVPTLYRMEDSGNSLEDVKREDRREDRPMNATATSVRSDDRGRSSSSSKPVEDEDNDRGNSSSSSAREDEGEDQGRGDEHRSEVAKFVRTLLEVADRDGGIGEQVREIAREQASSSEKVVSAVERVETRSRVRTFFFGSDYKNLGEIRSEVVQTRNRIEQLNREMERAASTTDMTAVQAEVQQMEEEQTRLESYIKTHEDTFSLFGWALKLFR